MNHDIHSESPIADRLAKRPKLGEPTPSLLDARAPAPDTPTPARGPQPVAEGPRVTPDLSLGAFFAQNRAVVDARRHELARVGMLPEHARALRMPDLDETVQPPAVLADDLPPVNEAGKVEPKKAPARPEGEVW